jgi:hypothetical protein
MYKFQVTQLDWSENPWFQNWGNIKVVDTWKDVSSDLPVIIGSNLLKYEVRQWLKTSQPAIYIGRGYLGNHIGKGRHGGDIA